MLSIVPSANEREGRICIYRARRRGGEREQHGAGRGVLGHGGVEQAPREPHPARRRLLARRSRHRHRRQRVPVRVVHLRRLRDTAVTLPTGWH
jgi:hypothetical protein